MQPSSYLGYFRENPDLVSRFGRRRCKASFSLEGIVLELVSWIERRRRLVPFSLEGIVLE
jgi:hypothetical protein